MSSQIYRHNNRINVEGDLYDFHKLLSTIHVAIYKACFSEIVLDLSRCTSAFQNSMLSLCVQVMAHRESGVQFMLIPPNDKRLLNLFINANWAHYLDPHQFAPSNFSGYTRSPATQYTTPSEQQIAVNKIVNVMLGAIPDMQRSDFAAFEWSINEITDNVLVHSESPVGGLVQVSTFVKNTKRVEFVVADAGIGIPNSLRQGDFDVTSDTDALDKAIREGVTRDKSLGQGNGLFGSYQICSNCNGRFSVDSGHARLEFKEKSLSIVDERIPYAGTLVAATVDFSQPNLLEEALRFKGEKYIPTDFVENHYEKDESGRVIFLLNKESQSFGSRVSGRPIRQKLSNLLRMHYGEKIYIDLNGVPLMSSSFADEAFGKLFLEAGAVTFMKKFEFINMMDTVEMLINRAISQRMSAGVVD